MGRDWRGIVDLMARKWWGMVIDGKVTARSLELGANFFLALQLLPWAQFQSHESTPGLTVLLQPLSPIGPLRYVLYIYHFG